MSPAAAWIAITGTLDPRMLILCAAVTLWVGGFDVLYACQDLDFDRAHGLRSIPVRFGIRRSLLISRAMHLVTVICLAALGPVAGLGGIYLAGVAGVKLEGQNAFWFDQLARGGTGDGHKQDRRRRSIRETFSEKWPGRLRSFRKCCNASGRPAWP